MPERRSRESRLCSSESATLTSRSFLFAFIRRDQHSSTVKLQLNQINLVMGITLAAFAINGNAAEPTINLNLRSRAAAADGKASEKIAQWEAKKTALIICDMWDDHWCKSASRRVGEMAGPLNEVVKAARSKGILIIHSPSTCVDFYKDTPQRKLAQSAPFKATPVPTAPTPRWGTMWCWPDAGREGVLPIDDSDMGCDCPEKCVIREAWKRQIAIIDIMEGDAITDNAQEVWNLLTARNIDNVVLSGVHLNMCVLGRPFAIRQMTYFGKKVALMRDMTDTMYNPQRPPGVSHFAGTDLVVQHVEKFWCPSFASEDITGRQPFQFKVTK